jgi:hypothetical protein
MDTNSGTYRPIWKNRRRVVFLSLTFCAGIIAYLAVWGADTAVNEAIATGVLILAASIIGSYVFGAVWDDKNVLESIRGPK